MSWHRIACSCGHSKKAHTINKGERASGSEYSSLADLHGLRSIVCALTLLLVGSHGLNSFFSGRKVVTVGALHIQLGFARKICCMKWFGRLCLHLRVGRGPPYSPQARVLSDEHCFLAAHAAIMRGDVSSWLCYQSQALVSGYPVGPIACDVVDL